LLRLTSMEPSYVITRVCNISFMPLKACTFKSMHFWVFHLW